MNKKEIKELADYVVSIAEQTGKKLLRYQKKLDQLTVTSKEAQGVFSEADVKAEKFIFKSLKKKTPNISILGEETAFEVYQGKKEAYEKYAKMDWVWVVDPLDGTNNFLNGLNYFAVCISLLHKGKPVIGVVHRPCPFETFVAHKEGGTYLKNEKGQRKKIYKEKLSKKLKESMLVTGFVTEKGKPDPREFQVFLNMMGNSRGIRRFGSAALDLCYVSKGEFDGFWEKGLAPWDVAAASLICSEAGVKVTEYNGSKFSVFGETILAARRPIWSQIKVIIQS